MAQLKKENKERILKQCRRCKGSGRIEYGTFSYGALCEGCVGKGYIMLIDETPCVECRGKRYQSVPQGRGGRSDRSEQSCLYCRGNGYQQSSILKNPKFTKDECVAVPCKSGFCPGRWSQCNVCEKGKVLIYKARIPCGFCHNSGKWHDRHTTCYVCKGTGWSFRAKNLMTLF